MRNYIASPLLIATLLIAGGVWAGCTVGFDPNQAGVFPCESDEHCIQGYECDIEEGAVEGWCEEITTGDPPPEAPPCDDSEDGIDQDGDQFGDHEDRRDCVARYGDSFGARDCDDTDATIYPGAPELCDDQDNDCDGEVDDFDCETTSDCGSPPSNSFYYICQSNTCTLRPVNVNNDACVESDVVESTDDLMLTCDSQAQNFTWESGGQTRTIEDVPAECR